ncbi:MAG: hypothetical protein ACJ77B_07030 [Chloroflexota bacterium]
MAARIAALVFALLLAAPTAIAAPAAPPRSAAQPAPAAAPKQMFTKKTGDDAPKVHKRGHVNVRDLAAKPKKAHKQVAKPFLRGPKISKSSTPRTATAGGVRVAPTPIGSSGASAPTTGTPIPGFSFVDGSDTGLVPADPSVAVGPDHVVEFVNTAARFKNRQGGVTTPDMSLFDFFFLPDFTNNSDGRILYDSLHGRWLATELSWDCAPEDDVDGTALIGRGYIDFAISDNADPTLGWTSYYFVYNDSIPDYPAPGTSTDKVALASNVYEMTACNTFGDQIGTELDVVDWAGLTRSTGLGAHDATSFVGSKDFTPRVAVQIPATSPTLYAATVITDPASPSTQGDVGYFTITGTTAAGTVLPSATTDLTAGPTALETFGDPQSPRQMTDNSTTPHHFLNGAVDGRPTDAIWQANKLAFVSTTECTPAGDLDGNDCVRVTELNTPTAASVTKRQDFVIGAVETDFYYGGIAYSLNGNLHVSYSQSSDTTPISTYTAYQRVGDAANTLSAAVLVNAGAPNQTNSDRWGDYLGVAYDPQVPGTVWSVGAATQADSSVGADDGQWTTNLVPLNTDNGATYVPITPARILDTRGNVNVSGRFPANAAKTIKVTGTITNFGASPVPSNAVAITGNVTVVSQTAAGFLSITPRPVNKPTSSTVNFPLGDTRANNVTTTIGPGGTIAGTYAAPAGKFTHVIFDVTGYFLAGGTKAAYTPITAARMLDSRPGSSIGGYSTKFSQGAARSVQIAGVGTVPANATAVTGNLTVTNQNSAGDLSIGPSSTPTGTSNLNYKLGDTRANGVSVKVDGTGKLWVLLHSSTTTAKADVIFDVTGYYGVDAGVGLRYFSLNPSRIMDTRSTVLTGLTNPQASTTGTTNRPLDTAGHQGIPTDASAVTGNLTVTRGTKAGDIRIVKNTADAQTSTLNFPAGDTRANGITVPLNATGDMRFIYHAATSGTVHLILDITGYFR